MEVPHFLVHDLSFIWDISLDPGKSKKIGSWLRLKI